MDLGFDPKAAVAESLGGKPPEDPAARPNLQASMALAVDTKPEYQAELRRVAKATGVPVDTVAAYPDELKKKATLSQFDFATYEKMFPASAAVLSNIDLAKIAHDDTDNMGAVEKVTTSFSRGLKNSLRGGDASAITESVEILGVIDRIESGELNDDVKLAQSTRYGSMFAGVQRTPERLQAARALHEQRIAENAIEFARRTKEVRDLPVSRDYQKFSETQGLGDAASALGDAPVSITSQVLSESTGALLPSLPFIVGGGAAGGARGLAAATGFTSSGTEYSTALAGIFDELGVDMADEKAVRAAMATSAFKEKNRQALIKAGVIGAFDAATAGVAGTRLVKSAVGNVAAQTGLQAAGGATGEVAGSVASGQEVSASAAIAEAIGEVPGALVDVGVITARNRKDNQKARAAEQNAKAVEELGQLAAESKLRERDPEAFRQLVEKAAENGTVRDIYINPQDLAQAGVDVVGLAGISPSVQEQLQQALDTGGDIKIPFGEYAANIAPSEFNQALTEHIKTEPEGMNLLEAQEFSKNQAAELQAQTEKVLAEKIDNEAFAASRKTVHEEILRQMNEANRFSPDVNESYATLHSNFATVYGAKLGLTPEEFYKQYYPQENKFVQAQGMTGGATLDLEQGALPEGYSSEVTFDSGGTRFTDTGRGTVTVTAPDGNLAGKVVFYRMNDGSVLISDQNTAEGHRRKGVATNMINSAMDKLGVDRVFVTNLKDDGAAFMRSQFNVRELSAEESKQYQLMRNERSSLAGSYAAGAVYYEVTRRAPVLNQSGKTPWQPDTEFTEAAKEYFGTTRDPMEAGYVLPDGTMLDFTGRHYSSDHPSLRGQRNVDHRELFGENSKGQSLDSFFGADDGMSGSEAMQEFMARTGAMRVDFRAGVASVMRPPSPKQIAALARTLKGQYSAVSYIDGDSGRIVDELESDNTQAAKLKQFFDDAASKPATGPLFQENSNKRGSFNPATSTITLLAKADLSTFLHESGHFFLETLNRIALDPNAPSDVKQDMDATLKWMGVQGESAEARLAAWNAMDLEQQRENHEKFARGFEAYLFEGRAPSLEIQRVFQRFRAWLMKVYRSLVALNVEINDDVRGVFDRMLASSEQIKEAEAARNFEPMFRTPEEAGMTPEEFKDYIDTGLQASMDAVHAFEKRSLRDMKWLSNAKGRALKKLQAEADTKRKAVRQEVTEQVMAEPVYRAREFLKRGMLDGEKAEGATKLYIPEIEAMYKDNAALGAIKEKLGYGKYGMLATENGVHPDQVAEIFGFESGDALVRELLAAENPQEKIDALTDKVMLERYGDLIDQDAVERAAERAIHSEARLRFVATEMAALLKQMGSVQELQRLAKAAAEAAIGQVPVRELNPNRYIAAGLRASRAAEKAIKSGDRNEAIRQKRLQLFHVAMTKQAMDARAEAEKALLRFRKLFRKDKALAKRYDMKLITAARAVLGAYGIGTKTNAVQALSDLEKVKEYDPEMYAQIEPVMRSALQGAGDYATLAYGDFKAMLDSVNQIVHSAKRSKQVRIDGELVSKKEVVAALRARMEQIGIPAVKVGDTAAVSDADRRKWTLQGLVSAARRVESWADSMDGGQFDGPFRKYLFQPISNAVTKYRAEKNRVLKEYVTLLREKQTEFNQAKVSAPEINYTFANKNELLGALLHIGNMSNKRKLLLGRGWATESVTSTGEKVLNTARMDAFLDRMIKEGTLTKSDFDFLQKVWDLMESIKGDAQKAHFDMYGQYFAEITADPVVTPFGTYRGGYAPAVADKEIVQDAAMKNEANVIEEGFNYMMPSTATGFTKSRVEYNKPLVMDLRLVASHIDQALRFTYVQPAVRDALRIIRSGTFAGPMQRMDPTVITEMLMPWLHRSARQLATSPWTGWGGKAADKFLKGLRQRTGMVAMTANFVNAFQQLTGLTMAAVKVKPRYLKGSLLRYMKAPGDTADSIKALSPWMAERLSAESFELRRAMDDILEDDTAWQKIKDLSARHAYFAQRAFQNAVDVVTWQAAFDEASSSMGEKEAVQFADSVVRQTQGTQSPEDIARFEASNAFVQLFTQFTGYFNMQANLLGTEYRKTMRDMGGDKGRLTYVYAMGFMLPAVIADGIVRTFGWDWDDEDDDGYLDEMFAWFFGSQLRTGVAMFPFVGSVANAGVNTLNKQPFDDRLSTSPSVSTIEGSLRAPVSVYKAAAGEGKASKAIGDVLTLVTMVTGVPVTAVSRPLKYAADTAQDRVEPAGVADAARGLISGKGREEERSR